MCPTVAFARLLFPSEAKLAMEVAHAQTTSMYPGLLASKGSNSDLREMDLNETPLVQNTRLLSRMEALSRTGRSSNSRYVCYVEKMVCGFCFFICFSFVLSTQLYVNWMMWVMAFGMLIFNRWTKHVLTHTTSTSYPSFSTSIMLLMDRFLLFYLFILLFFLFLYFYLSLMLSIFLCGCSGDG